MSNSFDPFPFLFTVQVCTYCYIYLDKDFENFNVKYTYICRGEKSMSKRRNSAQKSVDGDSVVPLKKSVVRPSGEAGSQDDLPLSQDSIASTDRDLLSNDCFKLLKEKGFADVAKVLQGWKDFFYQMFHLIIDMIEYFITCTCNSYDIHILEIKKNCYIYITLQMNITLFCFLLYIGLLKNPIKVNPDNFSRGSGCPNIRTICQLYKGVNDKVIPIHREN